MVQRADALRELLDALEGSLSYLADAGEPGLPRVAAPSPAAPAVVAPDRPDPPDRAEAPPRAPSPPTPAGGGVAHPASPPPPRPRPSDAPVIPGARAPSLFGAESGPPRPLAEVRAELGECTRCKLCEGRTNIVFGVGDPDADIVFVGEGPGEQEDLRGEPFVGRAGELLTKIIQNGMGLRREDVYICNIVKCRPPGNRDPERDEIAACLPFLEAQLRSIDPRVIVTLGRPSTSTLLGRAASITRVRGQWHEYLGIPLMPTYHPAYVLRRYTPEVRRQVWDDMKEVLRRVGRDVPGAP